MSYTVGWMRHAEQQLAAWISAYAQALQQIRDAVRDHHRRAAGRLAVLALVHGGLLG